MNAPVPVVALDDAASLVLTPEEPPLAAGDGCIRRLDPEPAPPVHAASEVLA